GNRDIGSPEVTADVAAGLGLDRAEILAAMEDPEIKERLRKETDAAIARGVFGSPYIIVDGEPFWGADRLDQVERWLATGGW
ncbi:MAG TPA: DsbA family protein, partial [Burkholderiales bacterium]